MKKIIIVTAFLFVAKIFNGQITITQSDMPLPGDTVRLSTTIDTIGLPNFVNTGTNFTWDFSALQALSQKVDTFLNVSSTPVLYQFYFNDPILYPAYVATVAQSAPNPPPVGPVTLTSVINYYKASSSAYENVGFGATLNSLPLSVKDDTIDYVYRFPLSYGNSDSCNSSYQIGIPGLGYYGERQRRVNHVDGWGILKTPYGTFPALRVFTKLFITDTLYIDTLHYGFSTPTTEQLQYKWLGAGQAEPLLQVNENVLFGLPVISSIVYRDSARPVPLSIMKFNSIAKQCSVFPNPAKDELFILSSATLQTTEIVLYNSVGQKVMQKRINQINAGTSYSLNVSSLTSGIYYLQLSGNQGTTTYKVVKE
jgi:hypothetical protein